MKRLAKIFSTFIALDFALIASANNGTNSGLTPLSLSDCNINKSTDTVEILVSEVPGHSFITCNAQVVALNPSRELFINEMNVAPRPTSPWVINTDGGESFACRDSLDNCRVLYQQ